MSLFAARSDGRLVRGLSSYQAFFPYLVERRSLSQLFLAQQLQMDRALEYLSRHNERPGAPKLALFHVFVAAGVRTMALRPQLNRFVKGRRIYQRDAIDISFVVKKKLTEDAGASVAKIRFEPKDTLLSVREKVEHHLAFKRSAAKSREEQERDFVMRLPRPLIGAAQATARLLDLVGVLPRGMIAADPLYASLFLSNHGSIGLDATYHHLFDWGTVSLFVIVGRLHKAPVVNSNGAVVARNVVDVTFTLDNRIVDGLYAANCVKVFRELAENPETIDHPRGEMS